VKTVIGWALLLLALWFWAVVGYFVGCLIGRPLDPFGNTLLGMVVSVFGGMALFGLHFAARGIGAQVFGDPDP
jgi:hypothetical protein